jgi:hypothetical protein
MRFTKIKKTKKRRQLVRVKKFGLYLLSKYFVLLDYSGVRGGGKCPEEEHTTCSGGPTINCHKRGLRGERIFSKIFYFRK